MSNKYLGRDTLRLCQYPVSQRPIPRCGISASPLQPLSPGSSYSKFLLSLFCVYYLEFLKGDSFYFLLYLFLMVYFYQHAPMDIYFILWVVAIEASTLSCCSICSSFGPWKCSQVASCVLSVEHPLVISFPPSWVLSRSWHYTMFLLIVCFSCPHPGSIHVSRGLQFCPLVHWKMVFVV